MSLISPAELRMVRRVVGDLMTDAWSLVRGTDTHTSEGTTTTWAAVASGQASDGTGAWFGPAQYQSREQDIGGAVAAIGTWTIALSATTVVSPKDRVLKGVKLAVGTAVAWTEGYRVFEILGHASDPTDEVVALVSAVEVT